MTACRAELILAVLVCLQVADRAAAQGVIVPLNTGQGRTLTSEFRALTVDGSQGPASLLFNFGFATAETPQPANFLDSITVTLQTTNRTLTAVYLTMDANGLQIAPSSAGAVALDPGKIQTSPFSYPSLQPVLPTRDAYQVTAAIPPEFDGQSVNVFFDLYDNLDSRASQAWFSDLRIAEVPEPAPCGLAALAAALWWLMRRRRAGGSA
jgi:uncharacterized protein (TIGR03382 family)